ncbi:MAG: hypothetical protein M1837_001890 [Sclerophora amabilis]|nr:MAG: hypothetical protein M1837_001890 [Sclerophora amabilis]
MFSSALKSFSSNILSNYTISSTHSSTSGPWKIFDAKKKSTGKTVSVFLFEKKTLEQNSGLGRSGVSSLRKVHDEVVERLRKEASSLARLRHPSVLELVEPVEDTRYGGLMFATEQVTASLGGLLEEKDAQENASGAGGRTSRYVVEETEGGGRRRREVEIDELEIQKGLLQIGKGLEFLHESAGLLHGNLTPEAIYINSKSDWKISGLAFSSAPHDSDKATSTGRISLAEVLNHDHRLPRSVQMDLDYTSPDFVLDNNLTTSADMFSLGLIIVALYNSPHASPLRSNASSSGYKRLFNSSSSTPSQSNQFLSSRPIPKDLVSAVLPRLLSRRPAQRITAREFQQSQYFDNILISTIRFLESFPAKTPNEKAQFLRGFSRVLPQFPKSVLEKKVLPALVEEMKDHDLLSLILQNVFKLIKTMPGGRRAFTDAVIPRLRGIFLSSGAPGRARGAPPERDVGKESGLKVVIDNLDIITENCSGKEFKDEILPLVRLGIESPTNTLVDASFRAVPTVLPVLDYSTVKHEYFPAVAAVFTKTSSLGIKVRGLEALVAFCGGAIENSTASSDQLNGNANEGRTDAKRASNSSALDKYTMQEKIVPLIKAIKTREPAVMMAVLNVFKRIGPVADSDFVAIEILPLLWTMSLGPLLNLQQFQAFMDLIKSLSRRIEQEHTRKLEELSSNSGTIPKNAENDDIMSFGATNNSNGIGSGEGDFESLVFGRRGGQSTNGGWDSASTARPQISRQHSKTDPPAFSWSTSSPADKSGSHNSTLSSGLGTFSSVQTDPKSRSITPDLSSFAPLAPSNPSNPSAFSPPLQPQNHQQQSNFGQFQQTLPGSNPSNLWSTQAASANSSLASANTLNGSMSSMSFGQTSQRPPNASLLSNPPPPPLSNTAFQTQSRSSSSFSSIPPPPAHNTSQQRTNGSNQYPAMSAPSSGLDKYESLL